MKVIKKVEKLPKKEKSISKPKSNVFSYLDSDDEVTEIVTKIVKKDNIIPKVEKHFQIEEESDGWKLATKKSHKQSNFNEGDLMILCVKCKYKFLFTKDEAYFFESKGWAPRKKCQKCKQIQKNKKW